MCRWQNSKRPTISSTGSIVASVDLPRFSGQLRAVGTSTEVRGSRWK